jgi:hypothetical protein
MVSILHFHICCNNKLYKQDTPLSLALQDKIYTYYSVVSLQTDYLFPDPIVIKLLNILKQICKTNTLPNLMQLMRISTTQDSSVMLRSKKLEIGKKVWKLWKSSRMNTGVSWN